jgi:hypothetical protein
MRRSLNDLRDEMRAVPRGDLAFADTKTARVTVKVADSLREATVEAVV